MIEAGKIAGPDLRQLYVVVGRLIINSSGLICSFGLALCVVLESVVVLQWIATGPPGKSMCERLGWIKISSHDEFVRFRPRRPLDVAE